MLDESKTVTPPPEHPLADVLLFKYQIDALNDQHRFNIIRRHRQCYTSQHALAKLFYLLMNDHITTDLKRSRSIEQKVF